MVKGWNRNRGWNNGWGANRKNRNGSWDLTWANHTEIVIVGRAQNEPIAGRERKTEGLVPETNGEGTMTRETGTIRVVVSVDHGNQILVWTPEFNQTQLEDWFSGLPEEAMENLWDDPQSLPGRVEQIALAASTAPTHVLNIESNNISMVRMKKGSPEKGTLLVREYSVKIS